MPKDLDSIEELNFIATVEEDAKIDAYITQLREWGYGSIREVNDLHQLFWELSQRNLVLDKLFRVAVVECIDEEPLYLKFLGMAKHYNGWKQQSIDKFGQQIKTLRKELNEQREENNSIHELFRKLQSENVKLKMEMLQMKPKSEGAQVNELRHELKKQYNLELAEIRAKHKPDKLIRQALLNDLCNPCSKMFNAFDLTREEDCQDYIQWFRKAGRKINNPTLRDIEQRYEGHDLGTFHSLVETYNAEWAAHHQGQSEEEEENA